MGGISIWQLVIVLGIVLLLFGTKRLRNLGGDLGSAIKGFKNAIGDEDKPAGQRDLDQSASIQHLAGSEQFNKAGDNPRS